MKWYERDATYRVGAILLIASGAIVSALYDKWVLPTFLPFLVGWGLGFFGGMWLSKLVRDRVWLKQESALLIYLSAIGFSYVLLLAFGIVQSWAFPASAALQGIGTAFGFHLPWNLSYMYEKHKREEVVDMLTSLAKRENFVITGLDSIAQLNKIVEENDETSVFSDLYERQRYKIFHEVWNRQREESRGELYDIAGIWEKAMKLRASVRERMQTLYGFSMIPERENLYPAFAKLPTLLTELRSLVIDLAQIIDDFDATSLGKLTGVSAKAGHVAWQAVLNHTGQEYDPKTIEILRNLRQIRHGFAHRWDEGFYQALEYFGLHQAFLSGVYTQVWIGLSKSYLESLDLILSHLTRWQYHSYREV